MTYLLLERFDKRQKKMPGYPGIENRKESGLGGTHDWVSEGYIISSRQNIKAVFVSFFSEPVKVFDSARRNSASGKLLLFVESRVDLTRFFNNRLTPSQT